VLPAGVGEASPQTSADAPAPSVRHLTTTASCIESLYELREPDQKSRQDIQRLIDDFAMGALSRPTERWESEEAAYVYCRVRALPAIIDHASLGVLEAHASKMAKLLEYAWAEVREAPRHQGIFEYAPRSQPPVDDNQNDYPPNTFLTYWGIRVLEALAGRNLLVPEIAELETKRQTALLWAERSLGAQVALRTATSDSSDPQQLAWAVTTVVRFGAERDISTPANVDLVRAGLEALFSQQRPAGNFTRGEPLFHYPAAGNAYCYTLETFAELLHLALERDRGAILRDALRPYGANLLDLWRWARESAREVGTKEEPAIGWCSGHHPHRTSPESWATAAGFHALQALRALLGVWAADSARLRLGVRKPKVSAREIALVELAERADTWDPKHGLDDQRENAAALFGSLFLNPVVAREARLASSAPTPERLDPDVFLIDATQARSAILFGPPGTSKTTMVELLAGAIGWDFVEILPSAFLAEGLDNVPKQADLIFQQIMELDRCVVLFDEADELIRDRSQESDPFGRFLTTSMLPKLAKLWEQRRVLFFLNTNWIDRADPAIKRSQRFDAAIFVLPPAFDRKKRMLQGVLSAECEAALTRDAIEKALQQADQPDSFGWFALLRYDQMPELKAALAQHVGGATTEHLRTELARIGEQLANSDWMPPPLKQGGDDKGKGPFETYRELAGAQRRDFGRLRYVRIATGTGTPPVNYSIAYRDAVSTYLVIPPGVVTPASILVGEDWVAERNEVLWYVVSSATLDAHPNPMDGRADESPSPDESLE
jgi:hypothetical protein